GCFQIGRLVGQEFPTGLLIKTVIRMIGQGTSFGILKMRLIGERIERPVLPEDFPKSLLIKFHMVLPQKKGIEGIYRFIDWVVAVVLVDVLPAHRSPAIFPPPLTHLPSDLYRRIGLFAGESVPQLRTEIPGFCLVGYAVCHLGLLLQTVLT